MRVRKVEVQRERDELTPLFPLELKEELRCKQDFYDEGDSTYWICTLTSGHPGLHAGHGNALLNGYWARGE